jgi:ferric-dicitrate binding protein FerR (iron transport regulator)
MGKVLDAGASDKEMKEFQELLLQDPQLQEVYTAVQRSWTKADQLQAFSRIKTRQIQEDWQKVYEEITGKRFVASGRPAPAKTRRMVLWPLRYAAALALLVVASAVFYWLGTQTHDLSVVAYNHVEAPMGSRSQVTLPDGSTVWLNAGSAISYPSNFNLANRDVTLNGEAFFDVQKQEIPFVVYVSDVAFRVLGTEFNLKAYDDDNTIEATLVSGSLKIEDASPERARFRDMVLEPNQKATFFREEGDLAIHTAEQEEEAMPEPLPVPSRPIAHIQIMQKQSVTHEVSWKDGILIFDGEPLSGLVRILERRYDVTFVFEDEKLREYRYSGTLRDQTLEQVLNAMKLTSPIDYTLDDKMVLIRINPKTKSDYFSHLY